MSTTLFTKIDNGILELKLTPIEKLTYVALKKFADYKTYTCFPSYSTVASIVGCSRRSVIRAVKVLEELNLIIKSHQFNSNKYTNKKEHTSNKYIISPKVGDAMSPPCDVDTLKQEPINKDIDIEDKEQVDVESIKKELQKKYSTRAVTQALYQLKKAINNNQTIYNIVQYLDRICKNFQIGLDLTTNIETDKTKLNKGLHNKKQYTNNNKNNNPYWTKFHNFEQRTSKYTAEELERIVLENQKKKFGTREFDPNYKPQFITI